MGTVEMKTPAMGMKLQMKTNSPSRPIPGIWRIHMPSVVRAVLAIAICACIDQWSSVSYSMVYTFIFICIHSPIPSTAVHEFIHLQLLPSANCPQHSR